MLVYFENVIWFPVHIGMTFLPEHIFVIPANAGIQRYE